MYEKIKKLYVEGRLNAQGVQNAVIKGWITQEQADEILSDMTLINAYAEKVKNGSIKIEDVPIKLRTYVKILAGG